MEWSEALNLQNHGERFDLERGRERETATDASAAEDGAAAAIGSTLWRERDASAESSCADLIRVQAYLGGW